MDELRDRARLADASTFEGRGITATVPRVDIEGVVRSADGPAELELDVAPRAEGETEAHTFRMEWDRHELEELLLNASSDEVTLVFDSAELERAMDADVEAHGIRETAAVFAVAAATAAAGAGHATASPVAVTDGGGASGAAPIEMVSDAASGGATGQSAATAAAQSPGLVSDAASSGPITAASAQPPELVSDAASSGPVTAASAELVSDAASSGPVTAASAQPPELVSDAASSGPATQAAEASSGGGFSISAPDAGTAGLIAGGAALFITAAGFAVRSQRRHVGQPT